MSALALSRYFSFDCLGLPRVADMEAALRGCVSRENGHLLLTALRLAKHYHDGQFRKSGEPYVSHPIAVAWFLTQVGVQDESTLAAALLHDVLEDCGYVVTAHGLVCDEGIPRRTVALVELLSQFEGESDDAYYVRAGSNPAAIIVKLADGLHNLLTMDGPWYPADRRRRKVQETRERVLPLIDSPCLLASCLAGAAGELASWVDDACASVTTFHASCASA